ncbi:uncharacterized protein LOC125488132 isoform X2 [Rhincodon typus]|uniref:uncharacterized protein LOC125488132 isoform X2 n=1 Tax=Rhincodon typus TaxID=259920 RepID=UPI002030717E|nr:uncharacterized protein LOC125488132 isoform X2 [Rhincodon typus]
MPPNVCHIHRATLMDSGWYRCAVFQNLLKFLPHWVEVTVQTPVSCPSISSDLKGSAVSGGDNFTIQCTSKRETLPINLMLYRHHQHLLSNTTVLSPGQPFSMSPCHLRGEGAMYSCGATNAGAHVINCSEPLALTVSERDHTAVNLVHLCLSLFVLIVMVVIIVEYFRSSLPLPDPHYMR